MSTAEMQFGLLVIGDEILSGKRQDKHLSKTIELLHARGLQLSWAEYLPDDPPLLIAALKRFFALPDAVIFSTGGIGATPDDYTRQCAAQALGLDLQLHPQAKALIEERMRQTARRAGKTYEPERAENVHRLNMGVFPAGAHIIPNAYNQIPGFYCRSKAGAQVYFMPGFPVMAWPMMEWVLDEHLHASRVSDWCERSVIVFGSGEALLTPVMEQIEAEYPDIKIFSLPSVDHPRYGHHIDLGVKGPAAVVDAAFDAMMAYLQPMGLKYGPQSRRS